MSKAAKVKKRMKLSKFIPNFDWIKSSKNQKIEWEVHVNSLLSLESNNHGITKGIITRFHYTSFGIIAEGNVRSALVIEDSLKIDAISKKL